jgi:tetratricopeptide (TPR) repeat protein
MARDKYSPCPCGSGKKFYRCCQPFYDQIEKAFQEQANRQHDAALQTMEQLAQKFPDSAEVWGRRAELLWENDRAEEAEKSLDKSLEVNPNYPFAYYLRGMLRHEEGELRGALLLYRKAAAVCDPEATDILGEVHINIGQCEMLLNHPLAALAAWEVALRCLPQNESVLNLLAQAREPGRFPKIVLAQHSFKKAGAASDQKAWATALAVGQSGRLNDALAAFEQITTANEQDTTAWYNLGLVRAWLGDNEAALDAIDEYVELEPDEQLAADAWSLAEVLRFGEEMEARCDHLEHRVSFEIRDPQFLAERLNNEKRLTDLHQAQGVLGGTLLDRDVPTPHDNFALFELPQVIAYLVIVGMRELRLMHSDVELLEKGRRAIQELAGSSLGEPRLDQRPPPFAEVTQFIFSIRFPEGLADDQVKRLLNAHLEKHFEEQWLHRPLKALGNISPIDAVGHAALRRKVIGVVNFLEDLTRSTVPFPYDFNRLRRKLGLAASEPAAATASADISVMSAADLAALEIEKLEDSRLHDAFQAAQRLDAGELAANFAQHLVKRSGGPADRFPIFQFLARHAAQSGNAAEAQSWIDAGLKHDCEHNEGRRRNDYEFRRAKLHLDAKEPDAAYDAFKRVLERTPSDLDVLLSATEGMLRAGKRDRAAEFAEQGLKAAKQKGARDLAGNFEEMLAAARR